VRAADHGGVGADQAERGDLPRERRAALQPGGGATGPGGADEAGAAHAGGAAAAQRGRAARGRGAAGECDARSSYAHGGREREARHGGVPAGDLAPRDLRDDHRVRGDEGGGREGCASALGA
jgi:hypothetical protein